MPKTVAEAFSVFPTRFAPSVVTVETASQRQTIIRNILSQRLTVSEDFLIGSYKKQTQIRPARDVDVFVVLDDTHWDSKFAKQPRLLLFEIIRAIRQTYPSTKIKPDGSAVQLLFTDRLCFDIVPAFRRGINKYVIPDLNSNSWIYCNPKLNLTRLTELNGNLNGRLKPLIKMIKVWARKNGAQLKSFHIECMVVDSLRLLNEKNIGSFDLSYSHLVLNFFDHTTRWIYQPIYDEVNERVDGYLDSGLRREAIWNRLNDALVISHRAWRLEQRGSQQGSIRRWGANLVDYSLFRTLNNMNDIIENITNEAKRLETDALYSSKGHFNAADDLERLHYWLGVIATVGSAIASGTILKELNGVWIYIGGISGLLAAIAGGVSTFIDPNKQASVHREGGSKYKHLKAKARMLYEIKANSGISHSELITELESLHNDSAHFSETYPVIPASAYKKAKVGINAGESYYD